MIDQESPVAKSAICLKKMRVLNPDLKSVKPTKQTTKNVKNQPISKKTATIDKPGSKKSKISPS